MANDLSKTPISGPLSEINGPESVLDSFMKSLDLQTLAKQIFQSLPEDLKEDFIILFPRNKFQIERNREQDEEVLQNFFQSPEITPGQ